MLEQQAVVLKLLITIVDVIEVSSKIKCVRTNLRWTEYGSVKDVSKVCVICVSCPFPVLL